MDGLVFLLFVIFMYLVIHGKPRFRRNRRKPTRKQVNELMADIDRFVKGKMK